MGERLGRAPEHEADAHAGGEKHREPGCSRVLWLGVVRPEDGVALPRKGQREADDDEEGDRQNVVPAHVRHDDFRNAGNDVVDALRPEGGEDDEDEGYAD